MEQRKVILMTTRRYDWRKGIPKKELEEVKTILEKDGVIIFPTDTVYGIGCNCYSEKAIRKIFEIKKRDYQKPINVLTDSVDKMLKIAKVSQKEKSLVERYMPGALTIILDKKEGLPGVLTSNLDTVGVRIPDDEIALTILKQFPYPLATTSANESGSTAGVEVLDFQEEFDGKVDAIIDGGKTKIQVASTIIRVEENKIKVLREGSIKVEEE